MMGGFKIFNFVLNLLDPDASVGESGVDWVPVTIDSWMIYFFYPQIFAMDKKAKDKAKSGIFGGYKKYVYLSKIIQEQAAKFNMKPHQLQALLWIASIRKYQPNASSKDIHSTMTFMINEFNTEQKEIQTMLKFVNNLQKVFK